MKRLPTKFNFKKNWIQKCNTELITVIILSKTLKFTLDKTHGQI